MRQEDADTVGKAFAAGSESVAASERPWSERRAIVEGRRRLFDRKHLGRTIGGVLSVGIFVLSLFVLARVFAGLDVGALRAAILAEERRGVHGVQRGPVTISEATEWGTIYGPDQVAAIAAVARDFGLPLHMDGARFANALVRAGCSPAELTWKAGVDVLSFGGTKNGLMGVEAVILFDPQRAREFELRRKRGGHLFSKHRFLAAQMAAYLHDDLWLDLARRANRAADRLAEGLVATGQAELVHPAEANMIFAHWPRRVHRTLFAAGAQYYLWEGTLDGGPEEAPLTARLVCDWSLPLDAADRFLAQFGS